jgi:hypothetical protein
MVRIKSHWNAIANRLNDHQYDLRDEAIHALARCIGDDMVTIRGEDDADYVYTSHERADCDISAALHGDLSSSRAVAIIEVVSRSQIEMPE